MDCRSQPPRDNTNPTSCGYLQRRIRNGISVKMNKMMIFKVTYSAKTRSIRSKIARKNRPKLLVERVDNLVERVDIIFERLLGRSAENLLAVRGGVFQPKFG
jgi:hypothetical protein